MTDEIEPCPWCSGKAFPQSPSLGHSSWRVVCDDCCAEGPTVPSYNVDDPEAFCVIAWNNRANTAALPTWDHYAEEHINTRPLPQPSELVAWLIERRVTPPQWSSESNPTGVGAFYSDPNRAHRFSTKVEAEEVMRRMAITPEERGQYFVSGHCWVGSAERPNHD